MLDDAVHTDQMLLIRRLFKNQDNSSLSVELKTVVQALTNGFSPLAGEVHLDGIGVS